MLNRWSLQVMRRRILRRVSSILFGHCSTGGSLPTQGVHRILVLRPNQRLGNMLLLTPLMAELEAIYPGAEVDLLSASAVAREVFAGYDSVRTHWQLPRRIVQRPWHTFGLLRSMLRRRYDLVIDPCPGSNSARLLLLASNAQYKLGFVGADFAGRINCGVAVPDGCQHLAKLPVYLLRRAHGQGRESRPSPALDLRLTERELEKGRAKIRALISDERKHVVALFGEATGAKAFSQSWWNSLIILLERTSVCPTWVEMVPASGQSKFANRYPTYYSTSIRSLGATMAAADMLVTADCGVMHLAIASGVTTAGVFSVTSAEQYAPYGHGSFSLDAASGLPDPVAGQLIDRWQEPQGALFPLERAL